MQILRFIIFTMQTYMSLSTNQEYLMPFEKWVDKFNIQFESDIHLYDILKKWIVNELYIKHINAENLPYKLAHNQFSGMDQFDFIKYVMKNNGLFNRKYERLKEFITQNETYMPPESVNWVQSGNVSSVNDQGQCGSCWAFSTTGALESAYSIKYGNLVSFSQQQLVDCDNVKNGGKDNGCNGGMMDNAFYWIGNNNGLCEESAYPYVSENGKSGLCQKTCENVQNSDIISVIDVYESDNHIMSAIAMQPVSVAIEADERDFQLYSSGVLTSKCGTNLDHGVLAVGYGSESGNDYYLVKNSWGVSWGENGYIKLGRGKEYNEGRGQCGILMDGSYPVLI